MKLEFTKGYYGPYSGKVRHVLYALNGYNLKGFEQKAEKPFEPIEIIVERSGEVMEFIDRQLAQPEKNHLEKVLTLIRGYESPYGLELLATVDFLISETGETDPEALMQAISKWSARKSSIFPIEHVRMAARYLRILSD